MRQSQRLKPVIRRFIDFPSMIPVKASANASNMSYCYEVGKLALKLLPIVLSRIKTPDQLKVYGNAGFLRRRQPFLLLKNHRLESEEAQAKARAMQKQLFEGVTLIPLRDFFSGPYNFECDRKTAAHSTKVFRINDIGDSS